MCDIARYVRVRICGEAFRGGFIPDVGFDCSPKSLCHRAVVEEVLEILRRGA